MKRKHSLLIGLVLAVAVVTVVWALTRGTGGESSAVTMREEEAPASAEPDQPLRGGMTEDEVQPLPEAPPAERTVVPDRLGELSVVVLDRDSGQPLPAVSVQIGRGGTDSPQAHISGDDGRCQFTALEPGKYTLSTVATDKEEYRCEPAQITIAEHERIVVDMHVERRWFLAGVVVERGTGRPVVGVGLAARGAEGSYGSVGTSSGTGGFRSPESFSAGPLTLYLAQRETYGLLRTIGDGPELVQITVGQEDVSRLTIEVDWTGVVKGVVLDGEDRPIVDAELRVLGADSIYLKNATMRYWGLYEGMRTMGRIERSDDDGRFRFERLPNDRLLVVVVSTPGFVTARSPDLSPPFAAGDEDVVLRLVPGGAIAGRVLDASGAPIDQAQVSALSVGSDHQPDPTRSNEDGEFLLTGLKPGPTEVTAQTRGENRRPVAVATGKTEVIAGRTIELVLQAGADGIHIRGIAVDQDGRAITRDRERLNVRVRPVEPLPGERRWGNDTPVNEDGTFDVTVAREGEYSLVLLGQAAGARWESLEVQAPAEDVRLTYAMGATCRLAWRIIDAETGDLVEAASYSIRWEAGSIGGNLLGGTHAMTVREGVYTLAADAAGYAPVTVELDLRGRMKPAMQVDLRLDRGRELSGVVMDAAGQPVKGCCIVLQLDGMLQTENMVYSDTDGRFTIPAVPLTGGTVCVIDESYYPIATAEIGAGDVVLTLEEN